MGAIVALAIDLGHLAEERGIRRAGAAIDSLVKLTARTAHKLTESGETDIASDILNVRDKVVVYPAKVIPPTEKFFPARLRSIRRILPANRRRSHAHSGDKVFHGTINLTGRIELEVEAVKSHSALGRVIDALSKAELSRANHTSFGTIYKRSFACRASFSGIDFRDHSRGESRYARCW